MGDPNPRGRPPSAQEGATRNSPLHAPEDPATAGHSVSVILVCHICEHLWEPTGEDRLGIPLACNECGGWTMIAELDEPTPDTTGPH